MGSKSSELVEKGIGHTGLKADTLDKTDCGDQVMMRQSSLTFWIETPYGMYCSITVSTSSYGLLSVYTIVVKLYAWLVTLESEQYYIHTPWELYYCW